MYKKTSLIMVDKLIKKVFPNYSSVLVMLGALVTFIWGFSASYSTNITTISKDVASIRETMEDIDIKVSKVADRVHDVEVLANNNKTSIVYLDKQCASIEKRLK